MSVSFSILGAAPIHHLNLLFLLGIALFGGTVGAKFFQRLHIPQVVGYIVIGLIIGESGLKLAKSDVVRLLEPFSLFALGIIGFMIGGELKLGVFKKYGKQFIAILLAEGLAAFFFVGSISGIIVYLFTGDVRAAVAVGVILGAISSATDPATTIQVLWEYKTRGIVTTTAISIVALDDALALGLYAVGTSIANMLTTHQQTGMLYALGSTFYEVILAIAVGIAAGLILAMVLFRVHDSDTVLTFTVGAVLLVIGLSATIEVDIILASMALGITMINAAPRRSTRVFDLIKKFSPPVYILFFVFVGARLKIDGLSHIMLLLVLAYVIARSIGKMAGCYLGAVWSKSGRTVKKYLGLCLFAQGGVAIGLSIAASRRLDGELSEIVVLVVTATTFIVQIAGPLFIKIGIKEAGEVGLNVTEEDLIKTYRVEDMAESDQPVIRFDTPLAKVVKIVGDTEKSYYPVVDSDKKLVGAITLDGIRRIFSTQELHSWLVALDIAEPVTAYLTPGAELSEALQTADSLYVQYLPVVTSEQEKTFVGVLDLQAIHRSLSAEVLSRQQKADTMGHIETT